MLPTQRAEHTFISQCLIPLSTSWILPSAHLHDGTADSNRCHKETSGGSFWPGLFHCATDSHEAFSFLWVNFPSEAWQSKTSDTFGLFAQLENKGHKKRFIFLTSYQFDWHGGLVLSSWDLAWVQCIWKPSYKRIKTTLTEILSTYQRQIKSDFPDASAELGKFHLLTSSTACR